MKNSIFTLLAIAILSSCTAPQEDAKAKEMPPGLDVTMMGEGVDPKEDFIDLPMAIGLIRRKSLLTKDAGEDSLS